MEIRFRNTAQVPEAAIQTIGNKLMPYLGYLQQIAQDDEYSVAESSINLPFDHTHLEKSLRLKAELGTEKLKYFILIGIGGSNLGAKAIYDALLGYFDPVEPSRYPKLIFLDTTDTKFQNKLTQLLQTVTAEEVIIDVVCKSGKTLETIVNTEIALANNTNLLDRVVITSDPSTALYKKAQTLNIKCLDIPPKVGGRYSVLTTVGLFPLVCIGVDTVALLAGAMEARKSCLSTDILANPAIISAAILYENYQTGKPINDNFFFHSELESLGKWYRQLTGESLGKNKTGITPTVSIGSTDLHSVVQLYLGGKSDKYFTFIWAEKEESSVSVPQHPVFKGILPEIEGKSVKAVRQAIISGVKSAYINKNIPFCEIVLPAITENALGSFMQFKMIETMLLAKLFEVDAFTQPNVEEYKTVTHELLSN